MWLVRATEIRKEKHLYPCRPHFLNMLDLSGCSLHDSVNGGLFVNSTSVHAQYKRYSYQTLSLKASMFSKSSQILTDFSIQTAFTIILIYCISIGTLLDQKSPVAGFYDVFSPWLYTCNDLLIFPKQLRRIFG